MSTSPALVKTCVDKCVGDLSAVTIPDECVDCIYQYSQTCSDLETKCDSACQLQQPQP